MRNIRIFSCLRVFLGCSSGGGEVKLTKYDKFVFKGVAIISISMGVIGFFAHGMIAKALA